MTDLAANPQQGKETFATQASSSRGHALLRVSSRSSSQKIEPSPTTTGLSGATASGSRDSIGGISKRSRGSMTGRRRNGSASSNRSGAGTATSGPNSAGAAPKRKKGGLLSLLGCCGVPDNANTIEGGDEPVPSHKLDKIPQRQLTSSRRTITPSDQTTGSKTQVSEKDPQSAQAETAQDASKTSKRVSGSTAQDQSTLGEREADSKQTTLAGQTGPSITVNPPVAETHEAGEASEAISGQDVDGDVQMADAGSADEAAQAGTDLEEQQKQIPAPAAGPLADASQPTSTQADTVVAVAEPVPEQKWLLPPIQPHHKGRKCLVLDLDETLVHSSFKVSSQKRYPCRPSLLIRMHRYYTRPISRYQ